MDFSNRQNRFVRLDEVSAEYLKHIESLTQNDPYYPSYHIAPKHGLVNDPNGLSYFNGEHHIFYQWFPLGPVHGLKHWYHVSTKDFVHFKDRGVALYPDQDYDQHGCHTGVAVVEGEQLNLLYTGHLVYEPNSGHPTQVLAVMDKEGKIEKKGVVVDYNSQHYTHNMRDPVTMKREDDYYMLIGAESHQQQGKLALYHGRQIDAYQYKGNVDIGIGEFGYMWECPNYYEETGSGVFIFSPQGVTSDSKYDFNNVFSVVYIVGKPLDTENLKFEHQGYFELDKGFDFYAPQTYLDNKGRRILIGWLGNSKSEYPTDKNYWAHMLTLPREISIEGNKLRQTPLVELTDLRESSEVLRPQHELISRAFELEVSVEQDFVIEFANQSGDKMTFSGNETEWCLDRTHVTETHAEQFGTVRYALRQSNDSLVRVFVDHSSIEIFCDFGETVFTSRIFVSDLNQLHLSKATGQIHYLSGIHYE
ncbi:sucrose-6-phosphate hydrolase [Vibrio sp. McD22-P3]|uniref:sucrose-6-phosphate hydrolase n=1 Tax=Vibrio sp. McD22-P3 TaxID=2724880 RepID=UPI001F3F8B58|nr:sucrose-6-phosphate hydrolase [Vibrio sp. McD22-P3]MCF4172331.1 sucrose-6-phosphate hydrolase [Vibrio sp. McD22-P3]